MKFSSAYSTRKEGRMGGRGGSSRKGSGGVETRESESPVSPLMSKVYYNAATKGNRSAYAWEGARDSSIEKAISTGNTDYINSIKTEKDARRVSEYLTARSSENNYKNKKLGSKEAVYKNQKVAQERRRLNSMNDAMRNKMHEFSKKPESGSTNIHDTSRTTTTYDRARKRRIAKPEAHA